MSRPVLRFGDRGGGVIELTDKLEKRGHLETVTGQFSSVVDAAVREFQARHLDERGRPLVVDGIVGPLTWWALDNPEVAQPDPPYHPSLPMPPEGAGTQIGRLALRVAINEALRGAQEVGANNSGIWVEKYLAGIVDTPANWCAAFVSWCFREAAKEMGIDMPYKYSLGARDIRNQFKRRGWTYESRDSSPEPGDIVVWWRGQPTGWRGHIGLVHHLSDGGILYTIEGNKGAFPTPVKQFDYVFSRMDRVLGFGRVPDPGDTTQ